MPEPPFVPKLVPPLLFPPSPVLALALEPEAKLPPVEYITLFRLDVFPIPAIP